VKRARWISWLAAGAALAGCAGKAPLLVEPQGGAASEGAPRIVLAPLNVGVELPADLEDAVPIVEAALIRDLQSRGARVAVIYPPDAAALWRASIVAAGPKAQEAGDLRAVAAAFARTLSESETYDALLVPSLALRPAKVSGRTAQWDGVRRRITVRQESTGNPASPAADAPILSDEGVALSREWQGRISGLSLHVLAVRPGLRRVLEHWGGLDLVHDAVSVEGSGTSRLRLQRDLLADPANVSEGVALALDPVWRSVAP
jgi:hypothetical protein